MIEFFLTGHHPLAARFRAGFNYKDEGAIDAPDFIPTGSTGCPMQHAVYGRDEVQE